MEKYKLPLCWLHMVINESPQPRQATMDDIAPGCICKTPKDALNCSEGHLDECHKGMSCEEAECSALQRYDPTYDPGFREEGAP